MRKKKDALHSATLRIYVILILGALVIITLTGRLFYWQIIQYSLLSARAASQYSLIKEVPATRGDILAEDGSVLATNIMTYDISVVAGEVKDIEEFSKKVAPFIDKEVSDIARMLREKNGYIVLKYRLEKKRFEELKAENIPELIYTERQSRFYPEKELFSHALGFVNLEGNGQYSLEEYYNGMLSGEEGKEYYEADPAKKSIPLGTREKVDAIEGAQIETTLDLRLQRELSELLEQKVKEFKADKGLILVMNSKTGQIASLVIYPSYDPNDYSRYFKEFGNDIFTNIAITNFEPGSIFKVITYAAGIDSKTITPNSTIYDSGKKQIGKNWIYNWDRKDYGYSDMIHLLMRSSNIGAAWVAEQMGKEIFNKYIQLFGFGKKTGVELVGEQPGVIHPLDRWSALDLNSIGFGQGIAVTPLQMVTAVNAIASKGNLFKPQIIKNISYKGEEKATMPRLMRKVVDEDTTRQLTDMLVENVRRGGAERAKVAGYTIAGKTGTAQVAMKDQSGYEEKKVIASFVGYAPAYDPEFTMLVRLDLNEEMEDVDRWGSQTAAPTFAEAAKIVFMHYGIMPE